MLAMTLGLGFWQLQRLAWKTNLLTAIETGEREAPLPLPASPVPFRRYTVSGTFSPAEAWYGAEVRQTPAGPTYGAHVLAMFKTPGKPPFVVDRGWAPDTSPPPTSQLPTSLEGYVRAPEQTPWMGARDDVTKRRFYALDPMAIGPSLGATEVAPFTFVVLGPPGTIPEPVQTMPRPPNDHLSYAVTWFSLSAALIVVFLVYVRQSLGGSIRQTEAID